MSISRSIVVWAGSALMAEYQLLKASVFRVAIWLASGVRSAMFVTLKRWMPSLASTGPPTWPTARGSTTACCSGESWYFATQPIAPPFLADASIEFSSASFAKSAPGASASAASLLARVLGSSAVTNSMTCHPKLDLTGSSSWPGVSPGA